MKKLIPLILFFILTGFVYAEEKIAVTTKSGVTYHWDNYYEKGDSYCTLRYGEFCIQKGSVASMVTGEKEKLPSVKLVDPDDPRVIQRNKKWQEEYESRVLAIQLEKIGEENKKYELIRQSQEIYTTLEKGNIESKNISKKSRKPSSDVRDVRKDQKVPSIDYDSQYKYTYRGKKYEYDLRKAGDRVRYSVDVNAQIKDSVKDINNPSWEMYKDGYDGGHVYRGVK